MSPHRPVTLRPGGLQSRGIAALCVCLTLITASSAFADEVRFGANALESRVSSTASAVAAGDLDGDGRLDLVGVPDQANGQWGRLFVALGDGHGWFTTATACPAPSGGPVALAELNGDGRLDVVALGRGTGLVSVWLGQGGGLLGARLDRAVGGDLVALAGGDVDGDGRPDIVLLDAGVEPDRAATVSVLPGLGDGTFGTAITSDATAGGRALAIGDLDRDGHPDVVVGGAAGVVLLRGDGHGAFAPGVVVLQDSAVSAVAIEDLDRDGSLDVVAMCGSRISAALSDGGGGFSPRIDSAAPSGSWAFADFDGNGTVDVLVTGSGKSAVLFGRGDGSFVPGPVAAGGGATVLGDANGDGRTDVISVAGGELLPLCGQSGDVRTRLGNGDGTFGRTQRIASAGYGPALADLDGDGRLDLVVSSYEPDAPHGAVIVMRGLGDGAFAAGVAYPTGPAPGQALIADFDRDGHPDVAVAVRGTSAAPCSTVTVFLGVGDGTLGPGRDFATGVAPWVLRAGDLNGDGNPDLVVANGKFSVLLGNGDGTFAAHRDGRVSGLTAYALAIADVTGDGRPDLIVGEPGFSDEGTWWPGTVAIAPGNGDGTFGAPVARCNVAELSEIAVGDLDQNGVPDLVVADGQASVLLGLGGGAFAPARVFRAGIRTTGVAIADVDGDGHADVVAASTGTYRFEGTYCSDGVGTLTVLRGDGTGSLAPARDYGLGGWSVGSIAIGDLDGDGRPDIVATAGGLDSITVLRNLGTGGVTATLLALFEGAWTPEGVELRWRFGDPRTVASARIERGEGASGAWMAAAGERRDAAGTTVFLDRGALAGHTYRYRLMATLTDGRALAFGPLEVTAGEALRGFAIATVAPDPASDRARIEFTVASTAPVSLSVTDVQGRRVATLVDGVLGAGRYQAVWDGATERGRAPAGIYFARLETPAGPRVRRFALWR